MSKKILLLIVSVTLFSCFSVQKLEIPDELQEQLDMTKPVIIDREEVNGVACEIGDSIFKSLDINKDTSFFLGNNEILIFGKSRASALQKEKFEAIAYTRSTDKTFLPKGFVKYGTQDTVALYENVAILDSEEIKLVQIKVDLSEVNLKVVQDRKQKRKQSK